MTDDLARLRDLAARGELGRLPAAERNLLRPAAYKLAHPIVFDVVYRPVARRRGHHGCARGFRHLGECCLDGFHDDLEAVVDRMLGLTGKVADLEGWTARWGPKIAVDAYRARRSRVGALQRPRPTEWLSRALGRDPWLCALALRIQEWAGMPGGVGVTVWPVDSWAAQQGISPAEVLTDIEKVLAAMRERPTWYHRHIETPLGHKTPPVGGSPGEGIGDPRPLPPGDPADAEDARAGDLATLAVEAIRVRLGRGEDAAATVREVLRRLFLGGTGADEIGLIPGEGNGPEERVSALLDDAVAFEALVERVLRIVLGRTG